MSASHPDRCHDASGFTLLEMLVVLSIFAIAVSASVALVTPSGRSVELKGLAFTIAADLRAVRGEAIRSNRERTYQFDQERRTFAARYATREITLPADVAAEMVGAAPEMVEGRFGGVRFFPDGSSTGAKIRLLRRGEGYHIEIDWLTGMVRTIDAASQ